MNERDPRRRFGPRAQAYAAFRPSYPQAAVDAVFDGLGDPAQLTVADVGAGTGISSALFAARGAAVIAIEPNERMRAQARPQPRIEWRDGSAQQTGLSDASVDLVVACQAFHWFATPDVMAEFVRIARRRAALLQNERDERDPFTRAYGDLVRKHALDDTESLRARAPAIFAGFPNARVRASRAEGVVRLDRTALLGRAASSSYLPAEGEPARRLQRDLNALFDRYERDGAVAFHLVTLALIADVRR